MARLRGTAIRCLQMQAHSPYDQTIYIWCKGVSDGIFQQLALIYKVCTCVMRKLGMMIVYWCSLSCSILFEEYSTTTGISNLIVNAVSSVLVTCQECFPIWCRLFEIGALSFVYRPYHTSSLEVIYCNIFWQITRVTFGRHRLLYETRCCHSL